MEIRVVTVDATRKIVKQLPMIDTNIRFDDQPKVLGNLAEDAIEKGSDPMLLVEFKGVTCLMRRTYSQWDITHAGPRIILQ